MTPSTSTPAPSYCSACGGRLAPGDAFCSQCGSEVGRDDPADADRAWLRRRVQDLEVAGWEMEADHGDRVVLRKRGFGSPLAHVLLFPVSGGVLNVLYALYRYTAGAPRREVRADGTERSYPDDDRDLAGRLRTAAGVVGGAVGAGLAAVALLALNGAPAVATAAMAVLFLLASLLLVALPARESRRSPSTFGRERTVAEETVRNPPEPCTACDDRVHTGVRRSYGDRLYVAGLPVRTYREGEHVYCRDCAATHDSPTGNDAEPDADVDAELERLVES